MGAAKAKKEEKAAAGGDKVPKPDLDLIRKQAKDAKSIAEGGAPKGQKKKGKEDLSFLDNALKWSSVVYMVYDGVWYMVYDGIWIWYMVYYSIV